MNIQFTALHSIRPQKQNFTVFKATIQTDFDLEQDTFLKNKKEAKSPLNAYLKDVRKFPLLKREDEIRLGTIIQRCKKAISENEKKLETEKLSVEKRKELQEKNKELEKEKNNALTELVNSNLRLAISCAKEMAAKRGSHVDMLDLIQLGNKGLVKAAEKFEPSVGKFSTYAVYWIKQDMYRASNRIIHIPAHILDKNSKLNKMIQKLKDILGRDPSTKELEQFAASERAKVDKYYSATEKFKKAKTAPTHADISKESGLSGTDIVRIEKAVKKSKINRKQELTPEQIKNIVSFSPEDLKWILEARKIATTAFSIEEEDFEYGIDHLPAPKKESVSSGLEAQDNKKIVQKLISRLSPKHAEIIRKYFGIGQDKQTFAQIGKDSGLTKSRIEQIVRRACGEMAQIGENPFV